MSTAPRRSPCTAHFTAAVFDMDGVLFDTERIALDAWRSAFAERGVDVPTHALERIIGADLSGATAALNPFVPPGARFEDVAKRRLRIADEALEEHGLPLKAGVLELLSHLKATGVAMGLATSTVGARALDNLRTANIEDYFGAVIGGDQVRNVEARAMFGGHVAEGVMFALLEAALRARCEGREAREKGRREAGHGGRAEAERRGRPGVAALGAVAVHTRAPDALA